MGGNWASDRRAERGDVAPSRRRWSRLASLWLEECVALLMDKTECNTDWALACHSASGTVPLFGVAVGRWGDKVLRFTVASEGSAGIGGDLQLQMEGRGRQQVLHRAC